MSDAISKICGLFEPGYGYVKVNYQADEQTNERWHSDHLAFLREKYEIKQISDEHREILDSALALFDERSSPLMRYFGNAHVDFEEWFSSLREWIWRNKSVPSFLVDEDDPTFDILDDPTFDILNPKLLKGAMYLSRMVVGNINVCKVFCALVPLAVPDLQLVLAQVGVRMASIYYLERIAKVQDYDRSKKHYVPLDPERFKIIDSLWHIAYELCLLKKH